MDKLWHITLLGGLAAHGEGRCVVRFQTRRTGAVLAFLAFHLHHDHSRDLVADRVWPEADADGARVCLSSALHSLRRQLEPPGIPAGSVIAGTRTHIRLNPAAVTTDVLEFGKHASRAQQIPHGPERLALLARAVDAYGGDLLPDCVEDWVLTARERFALLYVRIARQLIRCCEEQGETERALEYALRAVAAAPAQEEAHFEVIRLNRALGRDADAARRYRDLERILEDEEGRPPSARTRKLVEGLRLPDRTVRLYAPRPRRSPSKLVQARSRPEEAPCQPLPAPRLPLDITRFFGRHPELAHLSALLGPHMPDTTAEYADARLVTVVGPGGCGKTRLAVEVARRLSESYDRAVTFVPLADVTGADQVAEAVRQRVCEQTDGKRAPLEQIEASLSGRPHLLLLDNAEHLGGPCAQLVERLLHRLPMLRCLVTSRTPLHVAGERAYPLQPLPVPERPGTPERLLEFASVAMFVDRAQGVQPAFQITPRNAAAVASLCQKLEGIPLAIELAAARAVALTPRQMLEELSQRFDFLVSRHRQPETRHRTLRAAIQWSFDLLPSAVREVFAGLSVFRGGWTLEAARAVFPGSRVLDCLEQLVEHSLVVAEDRGPEMRYRLLESLREFADEHLMPPDRTLYSERHAAYFLGLAEKMESRLRGPGAPEALALLDAEHDNLRAVLAAARGSAAGLRMASALWRFWSIRGHAAEGRRRLEEALAGCEHADAGIRVKGCNGLAVLCWNLGDYAEARRRAAKGVELARRAGDQAGTADGLNILGVLADEQGDHETALSYHQECLRIRRSCGDEWGTAGSLNNLAGIAHRTGDLAEARRCYDESQALYRRLGDRATAANVLSNLGAVAYQQRDYTTARSCFEQSLSIFRATGNTWGITVALYNLGETMYRECNHPEAAALVRESIRIRRELGDEPGISLPLITLANILAELGDLTGAVRLFAASNALRDRAGVPLTCFNREIVDEDVDTVRRRLRPQDFQAAWKYGHSLSLQDAVAYALEEPMVDELAARTVAIAGSPTFAL